MKKAKKARPASTRGDRRAQIWDVAQSDPDRAHQMVASLARSDRETRDLDRMLDALERAAEVAS